MAIPKQGSRRIVVDGNAYRWTVRPKPTYSQALAQSPLSFAVELEESGRSTLAVTVDSFRPDNWLALNGAAITPAVVARAICEAHKQGWQPERNGSPYELTISLEGN